MQDAALLSSPVRLCFSVIWRPCDRPCRRMNAPWAVDGQSFRFFIKRTSIDIVSAYANGDLHDHALAATAREWKIGNSGL